MEPYILPIHFENSQGKHEVSADSLFTFIEAYKEIAKIYGFNIDIQISVPREGGWKAYLIFAVTFIGFNPIITLLTGKTSEDWAKIGHVYSIQKINEFINHKAKDIPDEFPKECIKQKNKIYCQFQKDICIDGFEMGDFSAIHKNDFHLYINEITDEEDLYIGETNITVYSPDWKGKRSWRGKIDILEDKDTAFDFDKNLTGKFWEKVRSDTLLLHTADVMKVQLVKRPANKVKYLVIRVLTYNTEPVDNVLANIEIQKFAILENSEDPKPLLKQLDLFK